MVAEDGVAYGFGFEAGIDAGLVEGYGVEGGEYITVSPEFASGDRVASETEVTFIAADRYADNYRFLGFYKESTFENKITNGVSGLTYTVTATESSISDCSTSFWNSEW